MGKYFIKTYGCQMNKADSERIAFLLKSLGFEETKDREKANLVIINMCSVRQSAVDRVYGLINELKKKKKKQIIFLTGCILIEDKKKLEKKVEEILDIRELSLWPKTIKQYFPKIKERKINLPFKNYLSLPPLRKNKFLAYLPIMNGCNNFCSYCVVPYTRGREKYRPAGEIIAEAKKIIKEEYKEIVLLGQNVNSWKGNNKKGPQTFPQLLEKIASLPGNFWLNFLTSHPKDMSNELIEVMAKSKKCVPYVHLPVQSGNNEILKKMKRNYTVEHYQKLIEKIRKNFKKYRQGLEKYPTISTDIIVGFPGETKKQFQDTIKLFKKIKFDMAYIARYSPRPGTTAFYLKDNISLIEKKRREKILTEILKKSALENNKKYLNQVIEVLVENQRPSRNKKTTFEYLGKTKSQKTVTFEAKEKDLIGKWIKIKITQVNPWGLKGEIVKS